MFLTQWFQDLANGILDTPQKIRAAAVAEHQPKDTGAARFLGNYVDGYPSQTFFRMSHPRYFNTDSDLKNHARADWQNVDHRIALFAASLIEALRKRACPFYVHAAFRTREQQDALSSSVTNSRWPRAAHCQGKAVDIVHSRFHWDLTHMEWSVIGRIGLDVHARMMRDTPSQHRWEITWGGHWTKPYDPAHWEIKGWQSDVLERPEGQPIRKTPRGILSSNQ